MEIERKFLVEKIPDLTNAQAIHIEQGYLSFSPEVRIRKRDEIFYLTVKSDGDIAREEYEIEISLNKTDVAELDICQ
jgi:adenylate cyclase